MILEADPLFRAGDGRGVIDHRLPKHFVSSGSDTFIRYKMQSKPHSMRAETELLLVTGPIPTSSDCLHTIKDFYEVFGARKVLVIIRACCWLQVQGLKPQVNHKGRIWGIDEHIAILIVQVMIRVIDATPRPASSQ